jgi:hypothetical protein
MTKHIDWVKYPILEELLKTSSVAARWELDALLKDAAATTNELGEGCARCFGCFFCDVRSFK